MRIRNPVPFRQASWCLDAEGGGPGAVTLDRNIRAVLELYPFCIDPLLVNTSFTIAAGGSAQQVYTVPAVQPLRNFYVRAITIERVSGDNTTTNCTLASKVFEDEGGAAGTFMTIDSFAAVATRVVDLKGPLWLRPGDRVGFGLSGAGAAETVYALRLWTDRLRVG